MVFVSSARFPLSLLLYDVAVLYEQWQKALFERLEESAVARLRAGGA